MGLFFPAQPIVNPSGQLNVFLQSPTDLNLLSAVNSKVDLYTIPTGFRFLADQFAVMITAVTQNGTMSGITHPAIRILRNAVPSPGSDLHISNLIDLSDAGQNVQIVNKYWRTGGAVGGTTSTTGKATGAAGDVISAVITTAYVNGSNGYSVLNGKIFLAGWMIRL